MSVLQFKDVWVQYNQFLALKEIFLEINAGVIGLLGPNGAGKTTLIKSLLGLILPCRGEIEVMGISVKKCPLKIRKHIGYVPEGEAYLPGVSAVKFVAFAAELDGLDPKSALKRSHEVLEYTGLGEERYRKIEELSPGQRVRIKLAQALCHNIDLLILDEPMEGLDPIGRQNFLDLIKNVHQNTKVTILFSTHTLEDAEILCDQIIFLYLGKILGVQPLEKLMIPETGNYVVQVMGQRERFLDACKAGQIPAEVYREKKILLKKIFDPKIIFNMANQSQTTIQELFPWKPRLEDVFLKMIQPLSC
jgi:ABC-2 type transport system ATP-binding protein